MQLTGLQFAQIIPAVVKLDFRQSIDNALCENAVQPVPLLCHQSPNPVPLVKVYLAHVTLAAGPGVHTETVLNVVHIVTDEKLSVLPYISFFILVLFTFLDLKLFHFRNYRCIFIRF